MSAATGRDGGSTVFGWAMLGMLIANHAVFALGTVSPAMTAALAAAVVAIVLARPGLAWRADRPSWDARRIALGVVCVAPLVVQFALSANRDFPFGGDQSFHIGVAFRLLLWWLSPPLAPPPERADPEFSRLLLEAPWRLMASRIVAILAAGGAVLGIARRWPSAALPFAAVLLLAWGTIDTARELRYPAGGYHLALGFAPLGYLLGMPELAFRLANLAAVGIWLFWLRPALVGRLPDATAFAVSAAFLWNDVMMYYFDASYLEPVCALLLLLAVEVRLVRGPDATALGCLLIGFAATVKETAIFALPFMWLSAIPGRVPSRARVANATLAAFCAGLPFVLFYLANAAAGQSRPVAFVLWNGTESAVLGEIASRVIASGNGAGGIVLAASALALLAAIGRGIERPARILFAVAAAALVLFFVFERASAGYAGYLRFFIPAAAILAMAAFADLSRVAGRTAWAVAAAVAGLQAPGVWAMVERTTGDASARSFAEYYDSPIVFPIRALLDSALRENPALRGASADVSVPDLVVEAGASTGRYPMTLRFRHIVPPECGCSTALPNRIALFVRPVGYNADWKRAAGEPPLSFGPPAERLADWRAAAAAAPACEMQMRRTCRQVVVREEGGRIVGLLGAGPLP